MFGHITALDAGPRPVEPRGLAQHAAFAVNRVFGAQPSDWMMWAVLAAVALTPLVLRRRAVLFALVFIAVTWAQMFIATGAGGAVHHVILLWPFPALIVAAVSSELAGRMKRRGALVLAVITGGLCFSNLLVVNQYYVTLVRNGPSVRWTDAFPRLASWLAGARAQMIAVGDWGILETLNLISEGELPVTGVPRDPDAQTDVIPAMLAMPGVLWVVHNEAAEQWPGSKLALLKMAGKSGYSSELLQTIYDRNGRAIFEVFRFRRGG